MRFDSYHPAINLIYFAGVITATILFQHPVFLALSLLCAWAYSIKLNGLKGALFGVFTLVLAAGIGVWYATYHHFGITVLSTNIVGNRVTLESMVCGLAQGLTVAAVLLWMSCVHKIFTSDKIVYLFGKISPRLSLFLAIILRMVPRIKLQAKRITLAQKAIGRGINQGNILQRLYNCIRIFSILITWLLESFVTSSNSMRSRGTQLRGRTAFSIYRFDNRDRSLVIAFFFCLTLMIMGHLLKQTYIAYDPKIIYTPITAVSVIFYLGYGVFCLLPMALQIAGEIHFKNLQKQMKEKESHE